MADLYTDASALYGAIASVARKVIREETRDCFRVRKAVVTAAPDGAMCSVRFVGDEGAITLPYSSAVSSVSVGDVVWVAVLGLSMRNAIVWETADFQ